MKTKYDEITLSQSAKDQLKEMEQIKDIEPLKERKGNYINAMKYEKNKDWEQVRTNILGMLNAFQPTVIDNTEQVKSQCIQIIEDELDEAQNMYDDMKKDGLTAGSIECEGYIRACQIILSKIKEWV